MRGRSRGKGRRTATRRDDGRFRALVEAAPYGMHFYRLERGDRLVFTGANPAADRILRVENAAFVGKTIEEAFPPLALTEVPDRYRAAARDGIPWHTQQIRTRTAASPAPTRSTPSRPRRARWPRSSRT